MENNILSNSFIKQILPEFIFSKVQLPNCDFEIKKGGGTRQFFRLKYEDKAAILCIYDGAKEENFYYAQIAEFLKKLDLPVPCIFAHDAGLHFLLMEDLGISDLYSIASSEERVLATSLALKEIAKLHKYGYAEFQKSPFPIMQDGFNRGYYNWEADYFFKNALLEGLKVGISDSDKDKFWEETSRRIDFLLDLPKQLVHRDFQSQNILWNNGRVGFIDFQGMRVGTGFYDAASLIYDPYLVRTNNERRVLLDSYLEEMGLGTLQKTDPGVGKAFAYSAIQRLTQACGAYFFLSEKMGKARFRQYALPALNSMQEILSDLPEFPFLRRLISDLIVEELTLVSKK